MLVETGVPFNVLMAKPSSSGSLLGQFPSQKDCMADELENSGAPTRFVGSSRGISRLRLQPYGTGDFDGLRSRSPRLFWFPTHREAASPRSFGPGLGQSPTPTHRSQTPSGRPTRMIGGDACELNAEIRLWLRYASLRYSDGAGVPHHSRGSLPAGLEMG